MMNPLVCDVLKSDVELWGIYMQKKKPMYHSIYNMSFIMGPWGLATNHNNLYVYLVLK